MLADKWNVGVNTPTYELPRRKYDDSIEDLMSWAVAGPVGFIGRLRFLLVQYSKYPEGAISSSQYTWHC